MAGFVLSALYTLFLVLKCCTSGCSAVINRYGFNSKGVDAVRANLLSYKRGLLQRPVNKPGGLPGLVGVNLGRHYLHALALLCPVQALPLQSRHHALKMIPSMLWSKELRCMLQASPPAYAQALCNPQ